LAEAPQLCRENSARESERERERERGYKMKWSRGMKERGG
jgi:hypothetical protein